MAGLRRLPGQDRPGDPGRRARAPIAAPQHWLKPFGTSRPRRVLPEAWTERLPIEPFPLMTGPGRPGTPPPLAPGDRVLLHAVGHVRIFGIAEVTGDPEFRPDSPWAPRWPWILPCRLTAWVPRVSQGPHTSAVLTPRVIGRIQRGSLQVRLAPDEFDRARAALLACPEAVVPVARRR